MTGLLAVSVLYFDDCFECRVRSKFRCSIGQLNISSYICESLVLPTRMPSQNGRAGDGQTERMERSGGRSTNDARDNMPHGAVDGGEEHQTDTLICTITIIDFVRVHQFG